MLPYILTALAGLAVGVVAMRVLSAREPAAQAGEPAGGSTPAKAPGASIATTRNLLIGAGIMVLAGIAIYFLRPAESEAPGLALASPSAAGTDGLDDVDTMIARLEQRLKADPKDGEGWRMLGWSYAMTGRPEQAIEPYKRALALLPDSAAVHAGYGEALAGMAGDKVTNEAKAEFEAARRIDPTEPRSAYFLAMWDAQNGREKQALDAWIALANSGDPAAPWQADLHNQIAKLSQKLGVDVSSRLKSAPASGAQAPVVTAADVEAANALPKGEQQAMIDGMVEGLAERLAKNPADPDGWARLLRSRMVLGQGDQARKDLQAARKALAGDTAGLGKVNAAASAVGVPGA